LNGLPDGTDSLVNVLDFALVNALGNGIAHTQNFQPFVFVQPTHDRTNLGAANIQTDYDFFFHYQKIRLI
jgi:hypothetical protein